VIELRIEGIEEVSKMLKDAPRDVVARGFLKALGASGSVILQEVANRTPEDEGELIRALKMDVALDSQYRGGVVSIHFGKLSYIARFVEYGHRAVGHKPKKKLLARGKVEARPFMRPALAAAADRAIDEFATALAEELRGFYGT
jgi:HK97 gp10 family phage protein